MSAPDHGLAFRRTVGIVEGRQCGNFVRCTSRLFQDHRYVLRLGLVAAAGLSFRTFNSFGPESVMTLSDWWAENREAKQWPGYCSGTVNFASWWQVEFRVVATGSPTDKSLGPAMTKPNKCRHKLTHLRITRRDPADFSFDRSAQPTLQERLRPNAAGSTAAAWLCRSTASNRDTRDSATSSGGKVNRSDCCCLVGDRANVQQWGYRSRYVALTGQAIAAGWHQRITSLPPQLARQPDGVPEELSARKAVLPTAVSRYRTVLDYAARSTAADA